MFVDPLLLTLRLAAATTAILLAVALPLAWWISIGAGTLRAIVQAVLTLPLMLPPTVIGFYLLVGLGPLTTLGRLWIRVAGHPLAFSFSGLLLGSLVYSLPFAVQPLVAGFRGIDRGYLEASAGLGRGSFHTFTRVGLPLTRGSMLAAAVLTFTHTIGEFGVVLMLGGNIPGSTRTISIALYDLVQNGEYEAANRVALLLTGLSLLALLILYVRPARSRRVTHA